MTNVNIWNLKKKELQIYLTGRCKHSHHYYEHPSCFLKELNIDEKVGIFDIECSGLKADFGIMLTYCIKDENKDKYYTGRIRKKELKDYSFDKRLVENCIRDLGKFDKIITYYGSKFDFPFLRSRSLYWDIPFFKYNDLNHKDVYYSVKSKLCIHRNRLSDACRLLGIEGKTNIHSDYWIKALVGDKRSLDYVLEHNIADCDILEKLYHKMEVFTKNTNKSI